VPTIIAIFLTLGLGMSLPYLVVALFPQTAIKLPKPGAWMITLRRLLGIALALTAAWLIWVMAAQITTTHAVVFGELMTGIVLVLGLRKYTPRKALTTLGIVIFCVVAMLLGINGALKPKTAPEIDRQWLSYSPHALNADIAEGKVVFLDVTADWCLTCKANMKFTLSNADIAEHLFHSDVVAMQANWTNPDPAVTELLHKYGRYGIPFNAVFGPAAPQGIVLPELLTPQKVLDALGKAAGEKD
jgi:suppressor for copper-sensitivity B